MSKIFLTYKINIQQGHMSNNSSATCIEEEYWYELESLAKNAVAYERDEFYSRHEEINVKYGVAPKKYEYLYDKLIWEYHRDNRLGQAQ